MGAEVATYVGGIREALKERRSPTLGQQNPLIHKPDLYNSERVQVLKDVTLKAIDRYSGLIPSSFQSVYVNGGIGSSGQRLVAQFELPSISEAQITALETAVEDIYGVYTVKTRNYQVNSGVTAYRSWEPNYKSSPENNLNAFGWYLGPQTESLAATHQGVYLFRDLGFVTRDNFLDPVLPNKGYIVEVREADLYQTDIVGLVTQVATILGTGKAVDSSKLLYEVYYDLIRLGLKKMPDGDVFGLSNAYKEIKRGLLRPLANLGLSQGINEHATSALMVGVLGTGKTLLAEYLLQQDTGLIIAPVDITELSTELSAPSRDQKILSRISQFNYKTGIPIVVHIDDVEELSENYALLTNLMAGLRGNGFYAIASTTQPQEIPLPLLQPQRFGLLIHMGLPDFEARYQVLSSHTPVLSNKLGIPLFAKDEDRENILRELARKTNSFTARFLAEIPNAAKENLITRIADAKDQEVGLGEEDLEGHPFTSEDFLEAFSRVSSSYNKEEVRKRDQELADYVNNQKKRMGIVEQAKFKST